MSNTISRFLQDIDENIILPITHERNVRDTAGVRLDAKLAALGAKVAVIAWDGVSEPEIDDIPSGVNVTYNGTVYTGRMPAGPATDAKVYLVSNGTDYDRYASALDIHDSYFWLALGSTAITMEVVNNLDDGGTDKALSAEMGKTLKNMIVERDVFLTEEEYEELPVKDPFSIYYTYIDTV